MDDAARLAVLGQERAAAGDEAGALAAFAGAAALRPGDPDALANHGLALLRVGRPREALAVVEAALALAPDHGAAGANRGHALLAAGEPEAAAAAFAALLRKTPNLPDALVGMAMAQRALGHLGAALVAVERALALAPTLDAALGNRALLRLEAGDAAGSVTAALAAAAAAPDRLGHAANALMAMAYDITLDPQAATRAAADWGASLARVTPRLALPPRAPDRPLRVGYLSADLYRHPVGWLGAQAMLAHDPDRVVPLVYATGGRNDDLALRFRAGVPLWRDCFGLADAVIAQQIAADRVDVLVDLAGHTAGGRPRVLAMAPAPHIVTWLGHVGTTGIPNVGTILMDEWHAPPGSEALFTERVERLPGGRFAYAPPPEAPVPERRPGPITFGCFQALAKLNPEVAGVWAGVLAAVPGSRLLLRRRGLAEPWLRDRMLHLFATAGIDPARIDLEPDTDHAGLLADYGRIDVALDPFPFCGGASTAEALWMGVPVVTLPGRAAASRQSFAMLSAIGETATIAAGPDDYVGAVERALTVSARRSERRARLAESPLGDGVRLARGLEDAFARLAAG
jgi:predicted O-linked N-acetylglucosamine transferase (SPINDLY family)